MISLIVVALPQNIDIQSAGPLFCGGITVFNPLVQFGVKPTDSMAVIGIGGLGHMALQFLNAWGCEVTAFTSSEAKGTTAMERQHSKYFPPGDIVSMLVICNG